MAETQPNGTITYPEGLTIPPAPELDTAMMQGGMQHMLSQNLGRYVICEFYEGLSTKETRAGTLYDVGANYLVLYDDADQDYLVCDTESLRFVTFSMPEQHIAQEPMGQSQPEETAQPESQSNPTQGQALPPINGVQAVNGMSQAKAAFNYTKRRARR